MTTVPPKDEASAPKNEGKRRAIGELFGKGQLIGTTISPDGRIHHQDCSEHPVVRLQGHGHERSGREGKNQFPVFLALEDGCLAVRTIAPRRPACTDHMPARGTLLHEATHQMVMAGGAATPDSPSTIQPIVSFT